MHADVCLVALDHVTGGKKPEAIVELDHIFVCTRKGAPEAELLRAFGLAEGSGNIHPGQGTANRRFFFHNVMLELLWLQNPEEAKSLVTSPTGLFERCSLSDPNVSPLGFCFRPGEQAENPIPFPAWDYRPVFFPAPLVVKVGEAPLVEPMWFYLDFLSKPDPDELRQREPVDHGTGFREVTAVSVTLPSVLPLSAPATILNNVNGFSVQSGDRHGVEIEFDGGSAGKQHDFRPELPLVFTW